MNDVLINSKLDAIAWLSTGIRCYRIAIESLNLGSGAGFNRVVIAGFVRSYEGRKINAVSAYEKDTYRNQGV